MTVYNTPSDAANTAVRAFLTSVGEFYYQASFNTGSGKAKALWRQIQSDFDDSCAYCGKSEKMQIEHLVMFNRAEYGLHHPGNIVPVCRTCNEREKDENNRYLTWEAHLAVKCGGTSSPDFTIRRSRILAHIMNYKYPNLAQHEKSAISVIAESLYENIKSEAEKSLNMYKKLDSAFVKGAP